MTLAGYVCVQAGNASERIWRHQSWKKGQGLQLSAIYGNQLPLA